MQGDVLSGGIPKRLVLQKGIWSLEIVRQVAVERSVYRPVKQRIEGPDVILRYFKRAPELKGLGSGALQLLQSAPSDQDRSFDAVNGEWVPSSLSPSYVDELKRQHIRNAQQSTQTQLLAVRTEHVRLRHANRSLTTRVAELEKKVAWLANELEVVRAQRPMIVQAPVAELAEPEAVNVGSPAAIAVEAPTTDFQPFELPPADDLIRCIEQLIGSDVSAQELPNPVRVPEPKDGYFIAMLIDDKDVEVGAICLDLKATVFLGGTLLMVPESELTSQVRAKKASEDSIAASNEVCNALSASVNNVPGNPHVRTTFLALLTAETGPWLQSARAQLGLTDTLGGKVVVVAR
jgi:hypothetical protein